MIVEALPAPLLPLPATLFTAVGKRAAVVRLLDERSAAIVTDPAGPPGSIAILVRHGIRIFGTVEVDATGTRFVFEQPLEDWRRAQFVDARRCARPVIVDAKLAA